MTGEASEERMTPEERRDYLNAWFRWHMENEPSDYFRPRRRLVVTIDPGWYLAEPRQQDAPASEGGGVGDA